jgi:hypothetical protein
VEHHFESEHGKKALAVIGATVVAVLVVIPIINAIFGGFLPAPSALRT